MGFATERPPAGRREPAPVGGRPPWLRRHVALLVAVDAVAGAAATVLAHLWSFGLEPAELTVRSVSIPYVWLAAAVAPTWIGVLALSGGYDVGPFGTTLADQRRVVRAGATFLAVVAVAYFVAHLEELAPGFLVRTVPLAVVLTLLLRTLAQRRLDRQRRRGLAVRRALVVGSGRSVAEVVRHLADHDGIGLVVVGACVPLREVGDCSVAVHGETVPVVAASPDGVLDALAAASADALVLSGSQALRHLRSLSWRLQGSGVDVFVTPAPSLRAARHDVRPVAGLPLVYIDPLGPPLRPGRRGGRTGRYAGPLTASWDPVGAWNGRR